MYSTQQQIDYERKRQQEKESLQRTKLIQGMMLAPVLVLGWFPILWIMIKIFR